MPLVTMLMGEQVSMSRRACSNEQERNCKAYSMPCHGIFLIFIFSATWTLLSDIAKYSATSHNIS